MSEQLTRFMFEDILNMDRLFRMNFINSVSGFKSANLIGTTDGKGNENLAVFNSVVHIGSNPPYLGMILRPVTVPRHTYANIKKTGYYTINHIHTDIVAQAHQTSAKYAEEISEFSETNLTPEYLDDFVAPFVKESMIRLAMKFVEEIDIKVNDTKLLIGKVQDIYLPDDALDSDGSVLLEKYKTVSISGLDSYHSTNRIAKLKYARP